jgi:hypothetical protein
VLSEWQRKWINEARQMYHVNYYRSSFFKRPTSCSCDGANQPPMHREESSGNRVIRSELDVRRSPPRHASCAAACFGRVSLPLKAIVVDDEKLAIASLPSN